MCIISGPVNSVNSTKILGLPSKDGKRQLTVYSNAVATPGANAMCLPVPNPGTVKFEKVPKDIFKQCSNSFITSRGGGQSLGIDTTFGMKSRSPLPVETHGSYEVVLVPSMNDLDRVPARFTTLTPDVIEFLSTSYTGDFGVILCKLKKGSYDYEPFAYSHTIQANKQLFFPTKHYHVHDNSAKSNSWTSLDNEEPGWASAFVNSLLGREKANFPNREVMSVPDRVMPKLVNKGVADDWDHEIYSAMTPASSHNSRRKFISIPNKPFMNNTNVIEWNKMPEDYKYNSELSLRCKEMIGEGPNVDIEMSITA